MKRLWKHKWLVVPVALVVFLSVGAVAWATTTGGSDESDLVAENANTLVATAAVGDDEAVVCPMGDGVRQGIREAGAGMRKAMAAARDKWRENRAEKMEALRSEMTSADQALYDGLQAQLEEKKAALQEAREDLRETADQLRELCKKYLTDED